MTYDFVRGILVETTVRGDDDMTCKAIEIAMPEYRDDVVALLRGIVKGDVRQYLEGLCSQRVGIFFLEAIIGKENLCQCFRTWEHFSGDVVYPVMDRNTPGDARGQYDIANDMYIGEYGRLRKDLAKHILRQLEV